MTFSLTQVIAAISTALFGAGGGGGLMYYLLKKDDQDHDQNMEISDKFENRLNNVEKKLDETERELNALKERENKLVFQINVLIKRIELLVGKLDGYDELSDEEKQQLTTLPKYNPVDGDNGN